MLQYSSAAAVAAVARNLHVATAGSVAFNFTGVQSSLAAVNAASTGTIALTAANAAESIDFSAATGADLPAVFLGTAGNVTYTGTYTPYGGVYRLGGGGGTLTFNGNLTGTTNSALIGSGTVVLGGDNTFGGGLTLTGSTLQFSALGNLGAGPITVAGTSTLQWTGTNTADISTTLAGSRPVNMKSGITLTLDTQANSVTLANGIGGFGAGALVKTGAGTLTLNGVQTYTGATTINEGAIRLGHADALKSSAVTVTATNGLTFASGIPTFNIGSLAGAGDIVLTDGTQPRHVGQRREQGRHHVHRRAQRQRRNHQARHRHADASPTTSGRRTPAPRPSPVRQCPWRRQPLDQRRPALGLRQRSLHHADQRHSQRFRPTCAGRSKRRWHGHDPGQGRALENSQAFNGLTVSAGSSHLVFVQNSATLLNGSLGAITRNPGSGLNVLLPTSAAASAPPEP